MYVSNLCVSQSNSFTALSILFFRPPLHQPASKVRNKAWFGICEAFEAFLGSWTVILAALKHAAKMIKGVSEDVQVGWEESMSRGSSLLNRNPTQRSLHPHQSTSIHLNPPQATSIHLNPPQPTSVQMSAGNDTRGRIWNT